MFNIYRGSIYGIISDLSGLVSFLFGLVQAAYQFSITPLTSLRLSALHRYIVYTQRCNPPSPRPPLLSYPARHRTHTAQSDPRVRVLGPRPETVHGRVRRSAAVA